MFEFLLKEIFMLARNMKSTAGKRTCSKAQGKRK
jgi:hypothetical protein